MNIVNLLYSVIPYYARNDSIKNQHFNLLNVDYINIKDSL